MWGGSSDGVSRSSIWDTPDPLIPTSTSGSSSARSRLGLDLNLTPIADIGMSDADSPLDAFSIWANVDSTPAPYEGWTKDIKEE